MNDPKLKPAAAYIRVSTDNQTEFSPDSQIKTILKFAEQHGYTVPESFIFRDDGISGRHADKRPEFVRMIAAAKEKPSPFSTILLWKFSRFARNQEESIFYKAQLRRNGVEVISISEPMLDGPFGSLIERIIEWTDEYYSIRLSDEVRRGMLEKVERGQAVTIPPFGYNIVNKRYVPDPESADIVRMIFSDYLSGASMKGLARKLNRMGIRTARGNPWENRTVEYILRNPVYAGKIRWNPKRRTGRDYDDPDLIVIEGEHKPIISAKLFDKAQARLEKNAPNIIPYERTVQRGYMLHGLVRCSDCGSAMSRAQNGLQCTGYAHGRCAVSHYIGLKRINDLVLDVLAKIFGNACFEVTKKPYSNFNAAELIRKEEQRLERIRDAYESGVYTLDEFGERNAETIRRIADLRKLKSDKGSSQTKQLIPYLRSVDNDENNKNAVLKSVIKKIVFDRSKSAIRIYFI